MENPKGYIFIGLMMAVMLGWFFLHPNPKVVKRSTERSVSRVASDSKPEGDGSDKSLSEKETQTLDDIEGLTVAVIIYSEAYGDVVPGSLDALVGATHPGTSMIYLEEEQTVDAWGNPYRLVKSGPNGDYGQKFLIISDGQDEEPGTPDDLTTSEFNMLVLSMTRSYMDSQRQ